MGYTRVDDVAGGQDIMVLVPDTYNPAVGAPLILYHHGLGEDDDALLDDALKLGCVTALINAGFILAGTNAHGNSWGNDDALADYIALYNYCIANYTITYTCAWSQSMGGLSGLLSVVQGTIPYKGWLGTYPITNLADAWLTAAWKAQIKIAYGFADDADYAVSTAGHDPNLMAGALFTIRFRFYASYADAAVLKVNNSDLMYATIGANALENCLVPCVGPHGDPTHFRPAEYVEFFTRCATTIPRHMEFYAPLDTFLGSNAPTTNYGTNIYEYIGELNSAVATFRTLIKFDLSALPAAATITAATLSLWYATQDYSSNDRTYRIYRQKRAWVVNQATWNVYSTGNNWSTAGGFHADDCEQVAIGSRDFVAAEATNEWKIFTITAATKAALDLGNGWMIKADTEANDAYLLYSNDSIYQGYRPRLVIDYTVGGAAPAFMYYQRLRNMGR